MDFVIEQTLKEAEFRRKQEGRMLWLTFIERMSGILLAASVRAGGVVGAFLAAQYQHEKLAIAIAVSCIGTLAVASLRRKH